MTEGERAPWQEILCELEGGSSEDAELLGLELIELGAAGSEVLGPGRLRAFLRTSPAGAERIVRELRARGVSAAAARLPEDNWTQRCADLWREVRIGCLAIKPVLSDGGARCPAAKHSLRIIPSMGFGTGHHATTQLMLEMLQDPGLAASRPQHCLDLGTGSGILAIAAADLFAAAVDAVDTDVDALANAAENVGLNGMNALVRLQHGGIEGCGGRYDLVLANLYTDLLLALEPQLFSRLSPGGSLLLSGFASAEAAALQQAYPAPRWRPVRAMERAGWASLHLLRAD